MINPIQSVDLSALSVAERLVLVQDLWDSIIEEAEESPLTDEERHWLDQRLIQSQRLDTVWFTWDQVIANLRHERS